MTEHEIVDGFINAMRDAKMSPAEPIAHDLLGGGLVRFRIEGDSVSRENGWAVLHLNERPAGAFGCHKRGIKETWRADQPRREFTKEERLAYAKGMAEKRRLAAQARENAERAAAVKARGLLERAHPASSTHAYLQKKRIQPKGFYQVGDALVVPMTDFSGDLWNLQFIATDGQKRFLTGGRVSGLFWSVEGGGDCVLVGEGAATMAALHRATAWPCYASFSAGNLVAVAKTVRAIHPDFEIIVCADDDAHLVAHPTVGRNVGLDAAKAAAAAIGARLSVPPRSTRND